MENATKALGMAASVLIGILILGALIFLYTRMSEIKQVEQDSLSEQQASNFNKKFEAYNRSGVYGSEILSLANMVEDYNNKEANETKGYKKIELTVKMKNVESNQIFKRGSYNSKELEQCYKELSKNIKDINKTYKNKSLSYWANSYSELRATFNENTNPTFDKMNRELIPKYKALINEQEDIARKVFERPDFKYDLNGRIIEMIYKERGI